MKKLIYIVLSLLGLASLGRAEGRVPSDHFDGDTFHNIDAAARSHKSFWSVLKWKLESSPVTWPKQLIMDNLPFQVRLDSSPGDLKPRVTFVNHASALIEWNGLKIVTDPVISEKLGPFSILDLKRYRTAGVDLLGLPRLDYVFISHNHYDHLDLPTITALDLKFAPRFIVPLGMGVCFPESIRSRVSELDWWQSEVLLTSEVPPAGGATAGTGSGARMNLKLTLVPAQHWSKRTPFDTNKSLWGGMVLESAAVGTGDAGASSRETPKKIFFAGDTGYSDHFKLIRQRLGAMDLALLPIGAYEPRWFMRESHMNPDDAVLAHLDLEARKSVAIHFGTFRLTDEGIEDPVHDLEVAKKTRAVADDAFIAPKNGQSFEF